MRAAHGLPATFAHVAFSRDSESGFDGLRKVFQSVQRRRMPALTNIWHILRDAPWFAAAVWWHFAEKCVLPPTGSQFQLHLVTEQAPKPENRITLCAEARDVFGQPLAAIDWTVQEEDREAFWRTAELLSSAWLGSEIRSHAGLEMRDRSSVLGDLNDSGGIYHPAGTTRIGATAREGVVDDQLRVHGVPGLRALATSVFPSIGGSSPSLTLVEFALRIADDIANGRGQPKKAPSIA